MNLRQRRVNTKRSAWSEITHTIPYGTHKSARLNLGAGVHISLTSNQPSRKTTGSLRRLAHQNMYRPGIDLAVIVAMISASIDLIAMFLPWLAGLNVTYVSGKGLNSTVTVLLSAIDLLAYNRYLALLFVPPALTVLLIAFSLRSEGLLPPRVGYKTKARVLLLIAALASILPTYAFLQPALAGIPLAPRNLRFVTNWELGGAATMPIYGGFGFIFALGLKLIKD